MHLYNKNKVVQVKKGSFNRLGDTHIEVEFFQWPVVSLGYVLSGGCDVSFWSEQTTKPDVHRLKQQNRFNAQVSMLITMVQLESL